MTPENHHSTSRLQRLVDKLEHAPKEVEEFLNGTLSHSNRSAPLSPRAVTVLELPNLPFNAIAEFHHSGQDLQKLERRLKKLKKEELWLFIDRFPQSGSVSKKALKKELISFLIEVISSTTMRDDYFTS